MDAPSIADRKLGYFVLRFVLGFSILMHGLVRLPHLGVFADGLVKQFAGTILPATLVRWFGLSLVFAETLIGLLVLLGLWSRWALLLGAACMASLIFGTALRSEWNTLAIQLFYALLYAALIATREYNSYSVDGLAGR
jgi:thiosulfate dehydrogenase (quinone) large subunit